MSTVVNIWKQCEKIECHMLSSGFPALAKKRSTVREGQFEKLDKAFFMWFMQQRSKGVSVSGPLLQEKALQFFPNDLSRFKCRTLLKLALDGFTTFAPDISKLQANSEFWAPFGPILPKCMRFYCTTCTS